MEGPVTPEGGRRTTRAALAEIPARLDRMRVTPLQTQPVSIPSLLYTKLILILLIFHLNLTPKFLQ